MASFLGHVYPGVFFILSGLWWTIWISHLYRQSVKRNKQFRSAASFPWTFLPGQRKHWPIEGIIKVVASAIGILFESQILFGKPFYFSSRHHVTMYGGLMMTGIVDILKYHRFTLPPDMDYLSLAMAFTVEFLLFKFHLFGKSELNVLGHTLFLYPIGACILATLLDMRSRTEINWTLARAYFLMLQGTWCVHLGLITCPSGFYKWHSDDQHDLMMVTVLFVWHAILNMIVVLAIYSSVGVFHRKTSYKSDENHLVKSQTNTSRAEYSALTLGPDTDSD